MNRSINLSPWKEISISKDTQHHTLIDMATIIISDDEDYYIIEDDIEKIMDVSSMPHYIKEDWINYNKKELTQKTVDKHIREYFDRSEMLYTKDEEIEDILSTLRAIKRQLIIKSII